MVGFSGAYALIHALKASVPKLPSTRLYPWSLRPHSLSLDSLSPQSIDLDPCAAWQGREKDITLFSTVRSREKASIGFVADERRINVGLTRARCSLVVIGNAAALESDQRWSNLVDHAHRAG